MSAVEISAFLKDGDTSDKLIDIWKNYPILWNTKRGGCKNPRARDVALMEVTKKLGLKPSKHYKLVAARLRMIRDSYRKKVLTLALSETPPDYTEQKQKRNSLPMKRLEFLKSQFILDSGISIMPSSSKDEEVSVASSPEALLVDDVGEFYSLENSIDSDTQTQKQSSRRQQMDYETSVLSEHFTRDDAVTSTQSDSSIVNTANSSCGSSSSQLKESQDAGHIKRELNSDTYVEIKEEHPGIITADSSEMNDTFDYEESPSESEDNYHSGPGKDSDNYSFGSSTSNILRNHQVQNEGNDELGQDSNEASPYLIDWNMSSVEIYALLKKGYVTDKLIDIWREYPVLWDTKLEEFKIAKMRNSALNEVTKRIGLDPSQHCKLVSSRLRAIRDSYRKRLSTQTASEALQEYDDRKQKRNSLPMKRLEFLKSQFVSQIVIDAVPYSDTTFSCSKNDERIMASSPDRIIVDDVNEGCSRENNESVTRTRTASKEENSILIKQQMAQEDSVLITDNAGHPRNQTVVSRQDDSSIAVHSKEGHSSLQLRESEETRAGSSWERRRRKKSDSLVDQIVCAYEKMSSQTTKHEWAAPMSFIMSTKSREAQEAAVSALMQYFCKEVMPLMQRIDSENH